MAPKISPEQRLAKMQARGINVEDMKASEAEPKVDLPLRAPVTVRKYEMAVEIWEEFVSIRKDLGMPPKLDRSCSLPNISIFKSFMKYYASSRDGRLDEVPTLNSQITLWKYFTGGYFQRTEEKIPKDISAEVTNYIVTTLKEEMNTLDVHYKTFHVSREDVDVMVAHLLCNDDHEFEHERYRVQLAFAFDIFRSTGARAGAIVESSGYKKSGEAVLYQDFELYLQAGPTGNLEFVLLLNQRLVKGERQNSDVLPSPLQEHKKLRYNTPMRFIALAFADKAFKNISTIDELMALRLPPNKEIRQIEWATEALLTPVFRACSDGRITTRPLTYASLWDQVVELGKRVGHQDHVRVHGIRAAVAHAVDKVATPAERNKMMGHRSSTTFEKHYAPKQHLDAASIFLGEERREYHIDRLRVMGHRRDPDAPCKLSYAQECEFKSRPDILELNRMINDLNSQIERSSDPAMLLKERAKVYTKKSNLKRAARKKARQEWFKNSEEREFQRQLKGTHDIVLPRKSIFSKLRRLMPARHNIAELYHEEEGLRTKEGIQFLSSLVSLCVDDDRVAYRPGDQPINEVCPVEGCHKKVTELAPGYRAKHILRCRRAEHHRRNQHAGQKSRRHRNRKLPFAEYCYSCLKWSLSEKEWDEHCQEHADNPDIHCGVLKFRYTLVSAGCCPFCLGDQGLYVDKRTKQWLDKSTLLNHIDGHIEKITTFPISCPHPHSDCNNIQIHDEACLRAHFHDVHSIEEPRSNSLKRKRKPEVDEGYESALEGSSKRLC